MSYFKIVFLNLFFLNSVYANPEIKDVGPVVNVPEREVVKANDSKPVSVWVKDEENDEVIVLDQKLRKQIKTTTDQKATNVYDNEKSTQVLKEVVVTEVAKGIPKITYTVERGDTLQIISQKLYGTTKRWKEIFLLNEDKLSGESIKVGMKLICHQK